MGLLTNLFSLHGQKKPAGKQPEIAVLMGNAKFEQQINVEEEHQAALDAICGPRVARSINRFETAWLYLAEKKAGDKNAVAILIRDQLVGYLDSEVAKLYRQYLLAKGMPTAVGECRAVIRGGWLSSDGRKGPYEVWLDLPRLYPFYPVH